MEKKYRAFTNEEFLKLFDLGKLHSIRKIGSPCERLIITNIYVTKEGYLYANFNNSDTGYGPLWFLKECEYFDGEWKTFGVIDE